MRRSWRVMMAAALALAACQSLPNPLATPTPTLAAPTPTATVVPTATPDPQSIAGFFDLLARLEATREPDRPPLVNRYLAQLSVTPLIGDDQAIFIYQGAAAQVRLIGDMNSWRTDGPALARFPGTELWYAVLEYDPAARLEYQFLVDESRLVLDWLNPASQRGGVGVNSVLTMPAYTPPPEALPTPAPAGTLTTHTIDSATLGETRTLFVYEPAGQLVGQRFPTLYILDGNDYIAFAEAPVLLDRLIAGRVIPPLIAVFIPPIRRETEYAGDAAFLRFLADEAAPFIQQTYGTEPDPGRTAVIGPSLGGLAAVHAALNRPDRFGLAAGQSGAYTFAGANVIDQVRLQPRQPVRLYLVVGSFETAVGDDPATGNLLAGQRRLAEALLARGYDFTAVERPQGHNWGLWRDTFGEALAFLFAP